VATRTTIRFALAVLLALPAIAHARPPRAMARDADWWRERNREINEAPGRREARLIFLGDSITAGWPTVGQAVWEKHYARRKALAMGISGDRARHLLWRIRHGNLEGMSPRVAVVLVGGNDAYFRDATGSQIAEGIIAVVNEVRARLPRTRIILLGVLPHGPRPSTRIRVKIAEANRLASAIADGKMVCYLDIGDRLLRPDGILSPKVAYDYVHLTARGYQIWATAMEPKLCELLGER
jgi:beta-glucosidase